MPSTPLGGQISFSQIKDLTTDKLGYNPPNNVSLGTLASVVRQYGQKGPGGNNLAFSGFYGSTIAGYTIVTTSETFKQHYHNYDDGSINVWFRYNTFKSRERIGDGNRYYVRVTAQLDGSPTVSQVAAFFNWNGTGGNKITISNLNSGYYTVTVSDLTTGSVIGTNRVQVTYSGQNLTYHNNA